MKRLLILCCITWVHCIGAPTSKAPDAWNLVRAYNASTWIFYGEVVKVIPEPNFKTGVMGVAVSGIDEGALPMEEIVWSEAKEMTFAISEHFKEPIPEQFAAYLPDPDMDVWPHVMNEAGDVFLAQPKAPGDLLLKLSPGDRGLFFVRHYLGSAIPVLDQVRFGQRALDDLALLRAHRAAGDQSLEEIVKKARTQEAEKAAREAAEFKVFEDDYYKILRIQDIEIRRSMLKDLIARMGFEGLWSYFEFKERYLKQHGKHVKDSMIPSGPTEDKEKLWQNISGQLKKIEVILNARK